MIRVSPHARPRLGEPDSKATRPLWI